jgi:hypothetical protein
MTAMRLDDVRVLNKDSLVVVLRLLCDVAIDEMYWQCHSGRNQHVKASVPAVKMAVVVVGTVVGSCLRPCVDGGLVTQ